MRVRGLARGQESGCHWSRWRSGIPRWGLESLRPYRLSTLTWARSRPSWSLVGRLRQSMIYNLWQIKMSLAVWRDRSRDEGELEVGGSGEAEESEGQVEEQAE